MPCRAECRPPPATALPAAARCQRLPMSLPVLCYDTAVFLPYNYPCPPTRPPTTTLAAVAIVFFFFLEAENEFLLHNLLFTGFFGETYTGLVKATPTSQWTWPQEAVR